MRKNALLALSLIVSSLSLAQIKTARWTGQEDKNSDFAHVLSLVNQKTGLNLKQEDFSLLEDRPLATSRFVMFGQKSGDFPVRGQLIRIWSRLDNQETIQVEAHVDEPIPEGTIRLWAKRPALDSRSTIQLVKEQFKSQTTLRFEIFVGKMNGRIGNWCEV